MTAERFTCPCCGHLVFRKPPGSHDFCPVCGWEDDLSQLRFPRTCGANPVSLIDAQRNYLTFGASDKRRLDRVRQGRSDEPIDPGWRPIDPYVDDVEDSVPGKDYGMSYPRDSAALYYWRPTYWRAAKRG